MYYIDAADGKIRTVLGSGQKETEKIQWRAETGLFVSALSSAKYPDYAAGKKYVGRLMLRMMLDPGATMQAYVEYDSSGVWEQLWSMTGKTMQTFTFPVRPRRCDHFRLRLVGQGGAKLYSLTKTLEKGSDL